MEPYTHIQGAKTCDCDVGEMEAQQGNLSKSHSQGRVACPTSLVSQGVTLQGLWWRAGALENSQGHSPGAWWTQRQTSCPPSRGWEKVTAGTVEGLQSLQHLVEGEGKAHLARSPAQASTPCLRQRQGGKPRAS